MGKKLLKAASLAGVAVGLLTGCGSGAVEIPEERQFTYWIGTGENSAYYSDYRQNPVIDYLLSKPVMQDEAGKDVYIDFSFFIPPTGSARDNCNTMISTGDYTDIMDLSYYSGTVTELYQNGIAMDLTPYVEQYMPNYLSFLEENPELALTATNIVDGERKYLQLYRYSDSSEVYQWMGFEYRRDWIVKYGKNPVTGEGFSGTYTAQNEDGSWNTDSWEDDVVFPSGGKDPVYISDWEWMFEIFETAMEQEGIADGYCMSLYYPGYVETGELVSSFGGGTVNWFKNREGEIEFGATGDDFRTYVQCMNSWYAKGWIDTAFTEHASDMFYRIDDTSVRQGKVGLWLGMISQLMNNMDQGDGGYTDGIIVYACAAPVNDVYGTEAQQNKDPYCLYQTGREGAAVMVSTKAQDKDLGALFTFLDSLYTEEAAVMISNGLTKEQYEETRPQLYQDYGLEEGAYEDSGTLNEKGQKLYYANPVLKEYDDGLAVAARLERVVGLHSPAGAETKDITEPEFEEYERMYDNWNEVWFNTGRLGDSFTGQLSAEDASAFSSREVKIRDYLAKTIPEFIRGTKDPYDDEDWNQYLAMLNKYAPEKNTEIYQELLNLLNGQ